jgi:hypothetical protein
MTDQKTSDDAPANEEPSLVKAWAQDPNKFEAYIAEKLKSYAQQNIASTLEFVQRLGEAKTFQDVIQIQTEFMQSQLNSFGEQAKQFSEIYMKAGSGAFDMPFHMPS